jgi:hypothetical protein
VVIGGVPVILVSAGITGVVVGVDTMLGAGVAVATTGVVDWMGTEGDSIFVD